MVFEIEAWAFKPSAFSTLKWKNHLPSKLRGGAVALAISRPKNTSIPTFFKF